MAVNHNEKKQALKIILCLEQYLILRAFSFNNILNMLQVGCCFKFLFFA